TPSPRWPGLSPGRGTGWRRYLPTGGEWRASTKWSSSERCSVGGSIPERSLSVSPYITDASSHDREPRRVAVGLSGLLLLFVLREAEQMADHQRLRLLELTAGVSEGGARSEEHTSELQSRENLVCRL